MSSKLTLWSAVLSTLQAAQVSGHPLSFVPTNSIFDGIYPNLHDLPPAAFPAIVMEPDQDDEKFFTTGVPPAINSQFKIFISCLVKEAKFNKGISGDATLTPALTGILAFADAVKNVLQADQTLGGATGLQKIYFPTSKFFFESYPIRECKISVILESQLTTTSH